MPAILPSLLLCSSCDRGRQTGGLHIAQHVPCILTWGETRIPSHMQRAQPRALLIPNWHILIKDMSGCGSHFGTSDCTYLPAVCISFLAKEHSEGGNAVSKRKAIQRPRQGYYIPPVSLTETADTLTHNQNRFAIHGCSPVPRFQ